MIPQAQWRLLRHTAGCSGTLVTFFFFWKYMSTVQRRKSGCRKGQPIIQHNPIPWGQGRSEGLRTGKGMGGTVQE